jgi:hypothetical protein
MPRVWKAEMVEPTSAGSAATLRRFLWPVLVGAAAIAAIILMAAGFDVATMRSLGVVNTGPNYLRMSSCVDDALDLSAGQSFDVEIPKSSRIGCVVFIDQQYVGCLVIQPRDASPIDVLSRLDRQILRGSCEKIG